MGQSIGQSSAFSTNPYAPKPDALAGLLKQLSDSIRNNPQDPLPPEQMPTSGPINTDLYPSKPAQYQGPSTEDQLSQMEPGFRAMRGAGRPNLDFEPRAAGAVGSALQGLQSVNPTSKPNVDFEPRAAGAVGSPEPYQQSPASAGASQIPSMKRPSAAQGLSELGAGMSANVPIALRGLQEQRQGELEDRIDSGAGIVDTSREKAFLGRLNNDISESPYTGDAEQNRVESIRGLQQQAQLQGFESPQVASEYGRAQERRKLEIPVEAQRAAGQQDVLKQQEANKGALAIQESKGGQAENFLNMLNQTRASGGDVSHVTLPGGGGSVSYASGGNKIVPPALTTQLQKARQAYESSGGWFDFTQGAKKAALDQAIASVMNAHHAQPGIKDLVRSIAGNPRKSNLPADQLLSQIQPEDGSAMTPAEIQEFKDLLGIIRGRDF